MNSSTCILIVCLITEFFSSIHAGLLLNLLLGGNNAIPQQGPNLPFLNFNNNQNAPNDYPDYNLGTSRDMNYDRVNDYGAPQQQNYPTNEPRGDFNQQPESFNQNDYSGSQERDYNRNPSNSDDEEFRMGRPNIPSSTTLNNNLGNNQRQVNNNGYGDGKNVNKMNDGGNMLNSKEISKNNIAATIETQTKFKNTASPNITLYNNKVLPNLHLNDSNINSINILPLRAKIMNNSNIDAKNPTIEVVKIPAGFSLNKTTTENTVEIKNVVITTTKKILKPITKRKFFFQVKPVIPVPKRVSDMETVFYI